MSRIEELHAEIAELENSIYNYEIDPYDFEDQYCEALDCDGQVNVAGMYYVASHILREIDPMAYRCGLIDFVDSLDKSEIEELREMEEELEELQNELEELESEEEEEEE